jgi:pantoate--beta-alanine ligase
VASVVESVGQVREAVSRARAAGRRIGLVPTMGALHQGHVRLIEECTAAAQMTVVSIFVNPTQFGPSEDFDRYPRPVDDDVRICEAAGAQVVFVPSVSTIYPHGAASTVVEVSGLSDRLEGASRPGHFRGVATVVLKLFEIVAPDLAVFGQKDYQQQLIIKRLVVDLHVPVTLLVVPTVREGDGLALSSRNRYLNPAQRQAAPVLYRALERARLAIEAGERDGDRVRQILRETVELEDLARIDYVEVADPDTLEPVRDLDKCGRVVALVAARVGPSRLLDNGVFAVPGGGLAASG